MSRSYIFRAMTLVAASAILSSCVTGTQEPAPVSTYGSSAGLGSAGVHVVQGGDTLYGISQRYQISMRDIAYLNKMDAPFTLSSGQRLRLPPPQEYKVRDGDTLYEISRLFNTDTSAVARQNDLRAPYALKTGQVLRMPSSVAAPRPQPVAVLSERTAAGSAHGGRLASLEQQNAASGNVLKVPQNERERELKKALERESERGVNRTLQAEHIARTAEPEPVKALASAPATPVKISSPPPRRAGAKFLQPVTGKILSGYGPKHDGLHNDGINIAAARGTPVKAAENGVVVYVGNELKGSGNLILIRHADRYMSAYAHLNDFAVKRGDTVQRGQTVGTVGSTGAVTAPQLHFEIRQGTKAVNPQGYLGS